MLREELSFEAYVVLGNALHLLLHGVRAEDRQRLGLPVAELARLDAALEPVRANDMLATLERLAQPDRALLAKSLAMCERLADTQAEHLLGAPAAVRSEIVQSLLQPTQTAGDPA